MSPSTFHDINEPGAFVKKTTAASSPTAVEDAPVSTPVADEPEVRLSNPVFVKGNEGYKFNEKCFVQVNVEYLKKTMRKRVTFDLFVICDDQEDNLNCTTYADEDGGIAKAEVTLFYGEAYNQKLITDPAATCAYIFRARHSKGEKEVESERLEMPQRTRSAIAIRLNIDPNDEESQSDTFNLFSTDAKRSYDTTLTVQDDKIPGDGYVDLEFPDVDDSLTYTLKVNHGVEAGSYCLFESKACKELKHA